MHRSRHRALVLIPAVLLALSPVSFGFADGGATQAAGGVQISSDPFNAPTIGEHHTEVEPDTFAFGSTIVSAFQEGRVSDGGSTSTGWATSTNGGATWQHGTFPGITTNDSPPGPYDRASDPAVAYDARYGKWLVSSLTINSAGTGVGIDVSPSSDGITWGNPVVAATAGGSSFFDKSWIVCDNSASSPFYGNCYIEFDDNGQGNLAQMLTSTDGGQTWSAPATPAGSPGVIGGQPLVQPNGTVIVPIDDAFESNVEAFRSTDGGTTWSSPVHVSNITSHGVAGGLRTEPLPSAEIDGSGKVYVVWQDCRFESSCSANDIVMSTSTDGVSWTAPARIPIHAVGSGFDHFIPGLGVDSSTSGSSAHLALGFYFYPNAKCSPSTCQLQMGVITSTNGGSTWSSPKIPNKTMQLSWLASTNQGYMVGDYMSTSILQGTAYPVFALASAPSGSVLAESMISAGIAVTAGSNPVEVWHGSTAPSAPTGSLATAH
jgi:hypothetical protein